MRLGRGLGKAGQGVCGSRAGSGESRERGKDLPGKGRQGVCRSPGQAVQAPDPLLLFPPSCSFLNDPQSGAYLTLLPTLPLKPLVSRLPVPTQRFIFDSPDAQFYLKK